MAATPINILIDGESLLKYFSQVSIKFSEGLFCNSIDLGIVSDELWSKFDPIKNFGLLRLQVVLGTINYEFLIEERNTSISIPGISFTSWGRSAQALLDKPYSNPLLIDLEEKIHPWQIGNTRATSIISYAINYCCSDYIKSKVVVHWEVEDFVVYKDTFSTSNSSPLDIISNLAGIIGAELVANADGSLTVQEYSVAEGLVIQEYNDLDHIISLNDDIVYPVGYNAVTVNGYGSGDSGGDKTSGYLSAELQEDNLKGWEFGRDRKVKIYTYHPKDLAVRCFQVGNGAVFMAYSSTEQKTERILLAWGDGNTQYPDLNGSTAVKGNEGIPLEYKTVSYTCRYYIAYIRSYIRKDDDPLSGVAAFYFSDYTNMTTIEFGYYDEEEAALSNKEQADADAKAAEDAEKALWEIQLELNETDADRDQFYLKGIIFGYNTSIVKKLYTTAGSYVQISGGGAVKNFTEDVTFTNGVGSLSHPFCTNITYSFYDHSGYTLLFESNKSNVVISNFDPTIHNSVSMASITYGSLFAEVMAPIPGSFAGKQFSICLDTTYGSSLSISKTVNNESIDPVITPDTVIKNVSLLIKDFATEVIIPNAQVIVDGTFRGVTNSEGVINLVGIAIGDHSIKIIASGYLDSDEDALANDTFTVS